MGALELAGRGLDVGRSPKREPASLLFLLHLSLAIVAGVSCLAGYFLIIMPELKIAVCFVFLCFFTYAVYQAGTKLEFHSAKAQSPNLVTRICLLDELGARMKEWTLINKVSMVIGRNDDGLRDVDIDLSDVQYASLVSQQHAVLNYALGEWYIEDLYAQNGVRLQKNGDETPYKLSKKAPCRLLAGDIIHIAHTRLLVQ